MCANELMLCVTFLAKNYNFVMYILICKFILLHYFKQQHTIHTNIRVVSHSQLNKLKKNRDYRLIIIQNIVHTSLILWIICISSLELT